GHARGFRRRGREQGAGAYLTHAGDHRAGPERWKRRGDRHGQCATAHGTARTTVMTREPLVVVGIGHDGPGGLAPEALEHIARARVLAGGQRHLAFFPDWQGEKLLIKTD